MFADTGIPLLFRTMYGSAAEKKNLVVKVAGGGALYDDKGLFNIGKRNYTVLRKMFWKSGVIIPAEDVGGAKGRTARLRVGDRACTIAPRARRWSCDRPRADPGQVEQLPTLPATVVRLSALLRDERAGRGRRRRRSSAPTRP